MVQSSVAMVHFVCGNIVCQCQQLVAKARGFALEEHALSMYAHCSKTDCPHRGSNGPR